VWALAALYNRVDSDDPGARYESVSLTTSRLLARNFRLVAEAARDVQHRHWRLTAGLVTAF